MKVFLAFCMFLTSLVPVAAAVGECVPTTCVSTMSYGSGSCDSAGYAYNAASAQSSAASFVYVSAWTWCWSSGSMSDGNAGVYVYATGSPAGTTSASAAWYAYDYGSFSGCGTIVSPPVGPAADLGCPAGGPPAVPGVLP